MTSRRKQLQSGLRRITNVNFEIFSIPDFIVTIEFHDDKSTGRADCYMKTSVYEIASQALSLLMDSSNYWIQQLFWFSKIKLIKIQFKFVCRQKNGNWKQLLEWYAYLVPSSGRNAFPHLPLKNFLLDMLKIEAKQTHSAISPTLD